MRGKQISKEREIIIGALFLIACSILLRGLCIYLCYLCEHCYVSIIEFTYEGFKIGGLTGGLFALLPYIYFVLAVLALLIVKYVIREGKSNE